MLVAMFQARRSRLRAQSKGGSQRLFQHLRAPAAGVIAQPTQWRQIVRRPQGVMALLHEIVHRLRRETIQLLRVRLAGLPLHILNQPGTDPLSA